MGIRTAHPRLRWHHASASGTCRVTLQINALRYGFHLQSSQSRRGPATMPPRRINVVPLTLPTQVSAPPSDAKLSIVTARDRNTNITMAAPTTEAPPTEFALALFNGFQALDAFGPLDTLNLLSRIDKDSNRKISLSLLAATKEAVSTAAPDAHQTIEQWVLPTHTFDNAPDNIEVLIIPGGQGTRKPETTQPIVDFLHARLPKLRFVMTICTGTVILARAGLLNGLRATTNKCAFDWVVEASKEGSPDVEWVRRARWVDTGKIWTASGVTAGMDAMFAFVAQQYGEDVAASIAETQEYTRHIDPTNDPFSKIDYTK